MLFPLASKSPQFWSVLELASPTVDQRELWSEGQVSPQIIGDLKMLIKDEDIFRAIQPNPPLGQLVYRLGELVRWITLQSEPSLTGTFDFNKHGCETKGIARKSDEVRDSSPNTCQR